MEQAYRLDAQYRHKAQVLQRLHQNIGQALHISLEAEAVRAHHSRMLRRWLPATLPAIFGAWLSHQSADLSTVIVCLFSLGVVLYCSACAVERASKRAISALIIVDLASQDRVEALARDSLLRPARAYEGSTETLLRASIQGDIQTERLLRASMPAESQKLSSSKGRSK